MNTTSISSPGARIGKLAAGTFLLTLGACIQGPWDYYPHNPPTFHGVFLTGYALAGQPLRHICFERMLDISEEATEAYGFYTKADVKVTGSFGGTVQALPLAAIVDTPNCFKGDSAALVEKGQAYVMDARITWDSAGHTVTSVLTGTAHVPAGFSIRRTASAPSFAKNGNLPANIFTPEYIASLPPDVRDTMRLDYGDTLTKLLGDSAALAAYLKTNGPSIQARLIELLNKTEYVYHEGDTLFYLTGTLNTLAHYYTSDRSSDVKGVLISQRFEATSSRPVTRFDSPIGLKPDSSDYYFPGTIRRLLDYPDAKGSHGFNLLDSMGVVNTWFHTGRNRLYFYGVEQPYIDFLSTTVAGNAKIKPKYNVTGGQGVFVGAVPDSFDVYIKVDSLTKAYPLPEVHAAYCRKNGWFDNEDCRTYYPSYCKEKGWIPDDCKISAVQTCMDTSLQSDATNKTMCDSIATPARADTAVLHAAETHFCVESDFPSSVAACDGPRTKCLDEHGTNDCKDALWDYCLDHQWRPDQCGPGLVSYCSDRPRLSETLCVHADAFCTEHAGYPLCQ